MKAGRNLLATLVGWGSGWLMAFSALVAWGESAAEPAAEGGVKLVGVLVVGSVEEVRRNDPLTSVNGVVVAGPAFLKQKEAGLQQALGRYIGQDLVQGGGVSWLTNILHTINVYCAQEADHNVVDSFFVQQGVASAMQNGRIQVVVFPGQLGSIRTTLLRRGILSGSVSTNLSQDSGTLRKKVRLAATLGVETNQPIVTSRLSRGLNVLNREPDYQEAGVTLQRGLALGRSDIQLSVTNRFPLEAFAGYDDAGNTLIGLDRVFAGGTYYDLWGHGHKAFYQFTAGADGFDYRSHSASYEIPVRAADSATVYGGYAEFNYDLAKAKGGTAGLNGFTEDGHNVLGGARYTHAFGDALRDREGNPRYRHAAFVGFDYKDIQASLQFSASEPLSDSAFTVAEFSVGYQGLLRDKWGYTSFILAGYVSPGDLFSGNDDESFNKVTAGADAQYFYGHFKLHRETRLVPRYLFWDLDADAQLASGALVPSEQMQFGGADSVRGFETGVIMGDQGFTVRNEIGIEVPEINRWLGLARREGAARLHGFFDYGVSYSSAANSAAIDGFALGSVGGGLSVRLGHLVDAHVDYGIQVIGENAEEVGGSAAKPIDSRLHVYIRIRF